MNGTNENRNHQKPAQNAEAHIGTGKGNRGESKTTLWKRWRGMRCRCSVETDTAYKYYGGKGISVCKEWDESFLVFKEWALKNGYRCDLQLDRIDGKMDYTPDNCRFVKQKTNLRNRSCTKLGIEKAEEIRRLHKTGKYTKTALGKMFGVTRQTATDVINYKIWV